MRRVVGQENAVLAALYGCPQEETTPPDDEYADVIYGGAATDEAMVALGSALENWRLQAPARPMPAAAWAG